MYQLVARARHGTLLFRTWTEGRALWDRVVAATPGLHALVLMPDHLHLVHPADVRPALARGLGGFTRWRNHHRGERGAGVAELPDAEWLADDQKIRRSVRYLALNPTRAGLARDPLEWPLSSYRDAVGLAVDSVRRPHPDPEGLHAYVSSDPSVSVTGTELPRRAGAVPKPVEVAHAVSALTRTPLSEVGRRGPARALYLRAAKVLCESSHGAIASTIGAQRHAVLRASATTDDDVRRIERVLGDPRFDPLLDGDLRLLPRWTRYRSRR